MSRTLAPAVDAPEPPPRARAAHPVAGEERQWFRIRDKAAGADTTEVDILDEIGGWFGGVDAKQVIKAIRAIETAKITVHLNSPGGDAFDGIAIYNALRDHKAEVTVIVEALAASAASYIAQAGDTVVMNRASQMMIHQSMGFAIGNADDMAKMTAVLAKMDQSISSIYAARSGRPQGEWLDAMNAETWYTAAEAVDAGLADRAADQSDENARKAVAQWNLGVFNYAGREKAPDPFAARTTAHATAPDAGASQPHQNKGAAMDLEKIREALGLDADVPEDQVRAQALQALGGQPPTAPPGGGDNPPPPAQPDIPANASGRVVVVDAKVWEDTQTQVARIDSLVAERQREKRDKVIDDAISKGKFAPSEREQWERTWDSSKDPAAVEALIDRLVPGRVPVSAMGYAGSEEAEDAAQDAEFDQLFPPHMRLGAKGRG